MIRFSLSCVLLSVPLAILGCGSGGGGTTSGGQTTPTITWATPAAITYGTALSATQLDATASVAGTFSYSPAAGTVLAAGSQTLKVTFTPADAADYTSATASVTLTVQKATPVITWATPAAVASGTALSATQLDATANVAGAFTYSPVLGTVMSTAGGNTLSAAFTPTDTADYNTADASVTLIVNPSTIAVDFGTTYQTIRGFGGSEAWSGVMPSNQINALYGTGSGQLGLTIMRVRIAPATWNSTAGTADTTQWTAELANGLAAQNLGAIVFASPWTPPASMKDNDSLYEGALSTSSYADYARYLEAYVNYATTQGVNLYAISMQNEPDWNPCGSGGVTSSSCYESCLWTGAQMDTWVAQNSSVLTTKLIMPESFYFAESMSDPTLNDASAVGHVAIIGGHLYGASPYYYTLAESLGKDVWMTEHYLVPVSGTATTSITDGLAEAEEIHNSMTVGQYNAYVYWWMVDSSDNSDGLIDESNNPTYFGDAIAQFSKFVRPGYQRVDIPATPAAGIYLSAYAGGGHEVIVAINSNTAPISLPLEFSGATVSSLTPYQTTAGGGVVQQTAVTVTGNAVTYTLPASSITTLVQ